MTSVPNAFTLLPSSINTACHLHIHQERDKLQDEILVYTLPWVWVDLASQDMLLMLQDKADPKEKMKNCNTECYFTDLLECKFT